uniref:Uncharacterized protein n=1 Tax=Spermophilus dauricus TaxID=99837 RepID=A0A8C9P234_SPEDA
MPQQLLITLPTKASTWVKLHHPRKAKEGAPLWEDVTKIFEAEGTVNLQGCICGLHSGGVGATGDAGELWEPGLSGISTLQTCCDFPVGERRRTMADGEKDFGRFIDERVNIIESTSPKDVPDILWIE